jgi:hypothetical protein
MIMSRCVIPVFLMQLWMLTFAFAGDTIVVPTKALAWTPVAYPEATLHARVPFLNPARDLERLDIWVPTGRVEQLPCVVLVHGGGYEDKMPEFINDARPLLNKGFVLAAPDYALLTDAPVPLCAWDVANAIRYLRANAETYQIDPERIGVWGWSAGGWIAQDLCYASPHRIVYTQWEEAYNLKFPRWFPMLEPHPQNAQSSVRVQAVVSDWGAGMIWDTRTQRANPPQYWMSPDDPPLFTCYNEAYNPTSSTPVRALRDRGIPADAVYGIVGSTHVPPITTPAVYENGSNTTWGAAVYQFLEQHVKNPDTATAPELIPHGGAINGPTEVRMLTVHPAGVIHYTLDGSDPGASSPQYDPYGSPLMITPGTVVKARVLRSGLNASRVSTASFVSGSKPPLILGAQRSYEAEVGKPFRIEFAATNSGNAHWYVGGAIGKRYSNFGGVAYSPAKTIPWMTIHTNTGVLSGVPGVQGVYPVIVSCMTKPASLTNDSPSGDAVMIVVNVVSNPLVANAGIDRNEEGLRPLSLDGSSSLNLGTGTVQYSWTQIANGAPAATLSNATQAVASFLPSAAGLYTFGLTLASGAYTNTDSVSVNVSVDSTPPHVLSAVGNADQSRVVVTFSEPVAESSATHPLSYSVDGGVTVLSATLTDGGTRVTLRTSPLAGGTTYHLSFVGILDRATVPNALTPGTSVEVSVPVPVGGRLPLTFSGHTGAALTNFPSLVVLGPAITNFGYGAFISPHGHDLRFWNDEETTQLAYEIESWGAAGDTNSQVWVSVPVLTNGTRLYATWGNPAETNRQAWSTNGIVWGSRYKGVWHMGETNAQDSSPQASHGTSRGNTAAAGVIGTAQYFNRAGSNHVRLANGGSFDLNEASVSFWFRGTNEMGCGIFGVGRDDATNTNHQCEISIGQNRTANYTNELVTHIHRDLSNTAYDHVSHTNADRSLLFDGAWHHVALTFSGLTNGTKIYLDGASRASSIVGADTGRFGITHMSPPANVAVLGGRYTTNFVNFLEGHLDEVRVADLARSPDWIRAEFLSVASNRTFLSYGAVIVQPAADGDGDGLPDGWELQYGGTNRFGAGESDYDHDGMDDTAEYIAGTVPTNKASVFSVSPGTHTGGLFVLTWESASGRLYRVYGATNLIAAPVEWELLPGTDGLIGTGWPMSYTSFPQQAAGFYRIDVRRLE